MAVTKKQKNLAGNDAGCTSKLLSYAKYDRVSRNKMLDSEIEALKKELYTMMEAGADFSRIYDVSVKLDSLIIKHYANLRVHDE